MKLQPTSQPVCLAQASAFWGDHRCSSPAARDRAALCKAKMKKNMNIRFIYQHTARLYLHRDFPFELLFMA
jgi:hypothetical protein